MDPSRITFIHSINNNLLSSICKTIHTHIQITHVHLFRRQTYDRQRLYLEASQYYTITKAQSELWKMNNYQQQLGESPDWLTLFLMLLLPFISFFARELCLFQFCSTRSLTNCLARFWHLPVVHATFWIWGNLNYLASSSFVSSTFPCVVGSNHSRRFSDDSFLDSSAHLPDFQRNWQNSGWHTLGRL